jgi:hypothetical protein
MSKLEQLTPNAALPHQLEAVYDYFMRLPRIRFLLADDPEQGRQRSGFFGAALLVVCRRSRILWRAELRRQRDDRSLPLFA